MPPRLVATLDCLLVPFVVVIDSREQNSWSFDGIRGDAHERNRLLIVQTAIATLATGDYSIEGFTDRLTIERKSLDDAFNTFIHDRERFERELDRMQSLDFSAVIIEAGWATILNHKPDNRKWNSKTVYRSVLAWQVRYPRTQWWAADTRSFAERTAFRLLQRFWLDEHERMT